LLYTYPSLASLFNDDDDYDDNNNIIMVVMIGKKYTLWKTGLGAHLPSCTAGTGSLS
jgi:hypothetical protein